MKNGSIEDIIGKKEYIKMIINNIISHSTKSCKKLSKQQRNIKPTQLSKLNSKLTELDLQITEENIKIRETVG